VELSTRLDAALSFTMPAPELSTGTGEWSVVGDFCLDRLGGLVCELAS
jgi:hypothetical protein